MSSPAQYPNKILLAVDGSKHSMAAAKMLHDLPLSPKAQIHARAVFLPREAGVKANKYEDALEKAHNILMGNPAKLDFELIGGKPAQELSKFADQHKPDLIVMGAQGLRSTMGILLGGVAQQILEYVCCPVMIVRFPYNNLRRIALVTDGSLYSQWAVDYLSRFALPENLQIDIVHVLPPLVQSNIANAKEEECEGQAIIDHALAFLDGAGRKAKGVLLRGDAASEIMQYSRNQELDLLVAGVRGYSDDAGWLLGSVARKLVHYTGTSVMIVKRQPEMQN